MDKDKIKEISTVEGDLMHYKGYNDRTLHCDAVDAVLLFAVRLKRWVSAAARFDDLKGDKGCAVTGMMGLIYLRIKGYGLPGTKPMYANGVVRKVGPRRMAACVDNGYVSIVDTSTGGLAYRFTPKGLRLIERVKWQAAEFLTSSGIGAVLGVDVDGSVCGGRCVHCGRVVLEAGKCAPKAGGD